MIQENKEEVIEEKSKIHTAYSDSELSPTKRQRQHKDSDDIVCTGEDGIDSPDVVTKEEEQNKTKHMSIEEIVDETPKSRPMNRNFQRQQTNASHNSAFSGNKEFITNSPDLIRKHSKSDDIADFELNLNKKISLSNASKEQEYVQLALNEIRGFFLGLKINFALALEKHRENHILRDGTTNFLERYPYILKSHSSKLYTEINSEWGIPNEIVPGMIWLGNGHHAQSKQIIEGMGITHVLNLTKEIPNCFEHDLNVKYLKIPVNDYTSSVISIFFKDCWEFMDGHRFGRI